MGVGIRKKDLGYLFASGMVGSLIPAVLFTTAETKIDSSIAGVLNGLTPLFTILVGSALFRLQISTRFLTGAIIGFAGMAFLILAGSHGNFWETNSFALLIVLATILYGFNVNIVNSRLNEVKSSHITSFSMMLVGPIALGYLVINAVESVHGSGQVSISSQNIEARLMDCIETRLA